MISMNTNIFRITQGEEEPPAPYLAAGRCNPQCIRRAAAALEVLLFSPGSCT